MSVNFRPVIHWPVNQLLLPPEYFGVQTPTGLSSLDVRAPKFVDAGEMSKLTTSMARSSSQGLSLVSGLVKPDLKVALNDSTQLAVRLKPGTPVRPNGPLDFQFQGGDIVVNLNLAVFILNSVSWNPVDDDLQVQIFAAVYGHELLHVFDELDIVSKWLQPQLLANTWIDTYLVKAQTYTFGTPSMTVAQVDSEFRARFFESLQVEVFNTWATESNRRSALRDAPAEYAKVQKVVDGLRIKQVNRPHP
jgi:hypothetical protein